MMWQIVAIVIVSLLVLVNGQSALWSVYKDGSNWKLASGNVKNNIFFCVSFIYKFKV